MSFTDWCKILMHLYILFSRAYEFLEQFKSVAQNNNFFDPGFSIQEMNHIPELYRSIIEDPAALHQHIKQAKGMLLFHLIKFTVFYMM